jgi:hypothetical protein
MSAKEVPDVFLVCTLAGTLHGDKFFKSEMGAKVWARGRLGDSAYRILRYTPAGLDAGMFTRPVGVPSSGEMPRALAGEEYQGRHKHDLKERG